MSTKPITLSIPGVYGPCGEPMHYQRDLTGVLPRAVRTFFQQPQSLTKWHVVLLAAYCEHYIMAPCWTTTGMENAFEALRREIAGVEEVNHLRNWLARALELGIDPF